MSNGRLVVESVEDLGWAIHTALRKCCDSEITTIAYNAIGITPEKDWRVWCELAWEALQDFATPRTVAYDLAQATHALPYGEHGTNLLRSIFDRFGPDDWMCATSYIWKAPVSEEYRTRRQEWIRAHEEKRRKQRS